MNNVTVLMGGIAKLPGPDTDKPIYCFHMAKQILGWLLLVL